MKYKSRTGKGLSDQSIIGDLGKGSKDVLSESPSAAGNILIGIFNFFIGVAAFISRSFLRVKLGERTFGIITVLSVYLIIWLMFMFPLAYEATIDEIFVGEDAIGIKIVAFLFTFFFLPIIAFTKPEQLQTLVPDLSVQVKLFILIILIISVGHLVELFRRRKRKEMIHSYYRGNSIFFGWMEDKVIGGFKINSLAIWMIVEPIFVLFVAYLVEDFLGYSQIGLILKFSAVCLFIEELRVYQENRRFILDMLDGQLDAAFVRDLQVEYQDSLDSTAKREGSSEYKASLGFKSQEGRSSKGSESPFRAKVL